MSPSELRELAFAGVCRLAVRLSLQLLPFKIFLRLARLRLPRSRHPLSFPQLLRVVRGSRFAGGSCLIESVVQKMFARRHGHATQSLTIGVARGHEGIRAHAWSDGDGAGFVPLWRESSGGPGRSWRA